MIQKYPLLLVNTFRLYAWETTDGICIVHDSKFCVLAEEYEN